ncbi:hypothetical protein [Saccharothrix xinjiangensis]|uniref:Uncharacterized protein n=1 Tax=Saccharothrix xinjiangensis TaxID=204798 RepID=A0ABV9XY93_9PSEU
MTDTRDTPAAPAQDQEWSTGTETGYPVPERPIMKFTWHTGAWFDVFELHTALIKSDLARVRAEGRAVVYLSCPISSRAGGHFATNVDIAHHTARRLTEQWGERFFFLNPADYQLESRQGTGLITRHIQALQGKYPGLTLEKLLSQATPTGGDYMRMWSRVLIEDDYLTDPARRDLKLGGAFDAYYFLGPTDAREFFARRSGGESLTDRMDGYFARRYGVDRQFYLDFATVLENGRRRPLDPIQPGDAVLYEARRRAFLVYYGTRAGTGFSLGSHDEWNIRHRLNQVRRADPVYGVGEEMAGFFDSRQLSLGDAEAETLPGYEVVDPEADAALRPRGTVAAIAPELPHGEVSWPFGIVPELVAPREPSDPSTERQHGDDTVVMRA